MKLWQPDLVGGVILADGRECKLVTGTDDHSTLRDQAGGNAEYVITRDNAEIRANEAWWLNTIPP